MKLFNSHKWILSLLLLSTLLYSCQFEDSDVLFLDKLDKSFDVSKFYAPKIKKSESMLASDVKNMNKQELKKVFETAIFKKDTIAIFDSEGSLPAPFYLESTSGWGTRNVKPKKYYGYRYTTLSYNEEKDTLAMLNGVVFPAVTMGENNDGKFDYLYASKTSKNKADFQNLQDFLQKTYTPLKISEEVGFGIKAWESPYFYYFLTKKDRKEELIFSFGEPEVERPPTTDVSDILLEIFSKEYIQEMRKERVYLREYIPVVK
ncbi:hypothetical protein [Sphingobacterium prati]|nr:hypothetical protein [uncultured Sphingobacterium sp.]NPE47318.1 hypothetical protein [Sphingobacterium prati]